MKLEERVARSIARREGVVILRSELAGLGSAAQLSRVLSTLVGAGKLVRVSPGIFAKTRVNRFTGRLAPAATFEAIAAEVFRKLKIDITPGELARDYNAGKTTQVPMLAVVDTGTRRITRKIQVGSRYVIYERKAKRQQKEKQP
ncbi:DUF6088 family protein [Paraburkholderia terrae]|uniref:DUF6088 family protein n=1 Tax=Paraburkholderia terrae TaxID=311230 RepID=UPI00296A9583|nr:DUF6088 family protein [Paraburkholderia terrae]MDW3662815.1 DUF6088 family protein [Paraburkholderia terrae]